MKVADCEKCKHHERRTWSHPHYCANYHTIGMSHAYAYCTKHCKRCADVKKCDEATK
jgi:hypothetical protein